MSKKHRRNRHQESAESATQTKPLSVESESHVELSNSSNKSKVKGWLSDLKRNWLMALIIGLVSLGVLGSGLSYLEKSAQEEIARRQSKGQLAQTEQTSLINRLNPFLPAPTPNPTPQLAKEYVYAGSRLLAVEDPNANAAPPADLAVWRPSSGVWWVMGGQGSQQTSQSWGMSGDVPVPGDYDGDGKTDFSIFRPSTNTWWVMKSSDSSYYSVTFGTSGDKTAQADFDGDGKTDPAVFRASNSTWYISQSSNNQTSQIQFGLSTDTPAPADYDGDGKADVGVWRNSNTTFYSTNSSNSQLSTATFSNSSTEPVSADYDGDGRADYAIRNGANWLIRNSTSGQIQTINWEQATDKAVQNDYDGDGKVDVAVWRDSNGNWYIRKSGSNGALRQETWGISGDIPVPAYYRR